LSWNLGHCYVMWNVVSMASIWIWYWDQKKEKKKKLSVVEQNVDCYHELLWYNVWYKHINSGTYILKETQCDINIPIQAIKYKWFLRHEITTFDKIVKSANKTQKSLCHSKQLQTRNVMEIYNHTSLMMVTTYVILKLNFNLFCRVYVLFDFDLNRVKKYYTYFLLS